MKILVPYIIFISFASSAFAWASTPLSSGEMIARADLVAIVQLNFSNVAQDKSSEIGEVPSGWRDRVEMVDTKFWVLSVFKGDSRIKEVTLAHYRFKAGMEFVNGSGLVHFNPDKMVQFFLVYFRKLPDGRWIPVTDQSQAFLSVAPLIAEFQDMRLPVRKVSGGKVQD